MNARASLLPHFANSTNRSRARTRGSRWAGPVSLLTLLLVAIPSAFAAQIDIPGPVGSIEFGSDVTVLPNGNFVVIDPKGAGAVHLYDRNGERISTLTGSSVNDRVGSSGVTVLATGHFVVGSTAWSLGSESSVGAVTWINADAGLDGVVSSGNSLVGSTSGDGVGHDVTALANGHYVVSAPDWDNGNTEDVGAVTWANGNTGISGAVSPGNSLIGGGAYDLVGGSVVALSNGNYVVGSSSWSNGTDESFGAATWANGSTGLTGTVSPLNSLIGGTANDQVSSPEITALTNGNYVVSSGSWHNGKMASAGAATWGDGESGTTGVVSVANSIVGTSANDNVGNTIHALANGNYVVSSFNWNNGAAARAGAATWGNGETGTSGEISAANSLVGNSANEELGRDSITVLTNGNYVVGSPSWDNGLLANAGAATWGDGDSGVSGEVSISNSLLGSVANDSVGVRITALANGHYVVASPYWNSGPTTQVGAATWGDGAMGTTGAVSAENSLIGGQAGDQVGGFGNIRALTNGNYVVGSQMWRNGAATSAGAFTWANGDTGLVGVVSAGNSMVGSKANDQVGGRIIPLANGHYFVSSSVWDDGATQDAGAVTWGDGSMASSGAVSSANSFVGQTSNSKVGSGQHRALSDGNYILHSPRWSDGALSMSGAVTFGPGGRPLLGTVDPGNSVLGGVEDEGDTMVFDYDPVRRYMVVGRPAENLVSLFVLPPIEVFADGFE